MSFVFETSKLRSMSCSFCEEEAVSICNFASDKFRGCGKPFCKTHGLFPQVTIFDQISSTSEQELCPLEEQRLALKEIAKASEKEFRLCHLCCPRCQELSSRQGWLTCIFDSIILVLALSVLVKLWPSGSETSADDLFSVAFQKAYSRRSNLTFNQHYQWFRYQNPDCDDFFPASGSGVSGRGENITFFDFRCECYFQDEARKNIINSKITKEQSCRPMDCPPTGTSFVTQPGICYEGSGDSKQVYDTGKKKPDGTAAVCPYYTIYREEANACYYEKCKGSYYSVSPDYRCRTCPLFTRNSGAPCTFGDVGYRTMLSRDYLMGKYRTSANWKRDCPTERAVDVEQTNGYRPRVIDEFGYYWCPEFVSAENPEGIERTCSWFEMTIQFAVKCKSPCIPCQEKWDFALKKCVAAQSNCSLYGLVLYSTGECSTERNISEPLLYTC